MTHQLSTLAVHAGRDDLADLGVHVPSLDLSTTYPVLDTGSGGAAYERLATGGRPEEGETLVYQRLWNPNVARFEDALAALESTEESVAFASGMAALTATLMACIVAGRPHVVAVRPLYGGSDHILETGVLGTEVTFTSADGVADAITDRTGLVLVESPGNPSLELLDIAAVATAAGDAPVMVDNTFATPVLQQPVRQGAALALHSATKYLGGHGDVLGGVVATNPEWAARLRQVRAITGAVLHPLAAYLLHRGLQTLPARMLAQQAAAGEIARRLAEHSLVDRVGYPGLGEDPLLGTQMSGPGAMVAFAPKGGAAAATKVVVGCRLITHAVSLGGVDSLIQHPCSLTHRPVVEEGRPDDDLLRLSVGLESVDDLMADLDAALRGASTGS